MPLTIKIASREFYDEQNKKFINVKETTLTLEHSLVSLHKWEQKWKKPFLKEDTMKELGPEAMLDYIRCMSMTRLADENVVYGLTPDQLKQINEYINDPMTATWFSEEKDPSKKKRGKKEIQTAEIIYWQMVALQIPKEFEKWHLNSLLTLIRVCGIKNEEQYNNSSSGGKGKTKKPNLRSRAALNAKRRAAMHSAG